MASPPKRAPVMPLSNAQLGGHRALVWALWVMQQVPTGFCSGSDGEESTCNAADLGSVPGLRICAGGGHGNPCQYFCLENPHGQRCLVGYSPWDHKESDTAEFLSTAHLFYKGWNGVGGGRKVQWGRTYVHLRLSHANVRAKPTQYCRAITLQLKINKSWQRKGKLSGMQSVRK